MKQFILLILSVLTLVNIANAQQRVVDVMDNSPVSSAAIFDAQGNVVGFTSSEGDFSDIPESDYPLTIRCIGYENIVVEQPKDTVVQMIPMIYELDEAVISASRDVMKQTFYVREYFTISSATDTITHFLEHMCDRYVPVSKKVKFKKNDLRYRNTRSYKYYQIDDRDSIAVSNKPDSKSLLDLLDAEEVDASESFKGQMGVNRYYEKKGKSGISHSRKQNEHTFTEYKDGLAGEKDHAINLPWLLRMLGVSMEAHQAYMTHVYKANDAAVYQPKDLIQAGVVVELLGKGKLLRQMVNSDIPVKIHFSMEYYVVSREYLSKDQAKEEYKAKNLKVPFEIPATVPQLSEATRKIIQRAEQK